MRNAFLTACLFSWCFAAFAQDAPLKKCSDDDHYNLLDFWVGDWTMYSGDQIVGENRIEKILAGCALLEHWTAEGGGEGKSLFFVDSGGTWQQIWVTEWAANSGGIKEKTFVAAAPDGAIQFQGELHDPKIGAYLDRTTLTPLDDGKVSQIIEISRDSGETWKTSFDAIYVPADRG